MVNNTERVDGLGPAVSRGREITESKLGTWKPLFRNYGSTPYSAGFSGGIHTSKEFPLYVPGVAELTGFLDYFQDEPFMTERVIIITPNRLLMASGDDVARIQRQTGSRLLRASFLTDQIQFEDIHDPFPFAIELKMPGVETFTNDFEYFNSQPVQALASYQGWDTMGSVEDFTALIPEDPNMLKVTQIRIVKF